MEKTKLQNLTRDICISSRLFTSMPAENVSLSVEFRSIMLSYAIVLIPLKFYALTLNAV